MKAYIMTTGAVFGLLVVAHIWRIIEEGAALAKDPSYILITLAAAGLCLWACRLLRLLSRSATID
jgi:tellurite resistance protein TehA-like permease